MAKGRVKWFDEKKGYGFIEPDGGGKDIFVHHTGISMRGFRKLEEGDVVTFELQEGPKGQQACKVTRIGSSLIKEER